MRYILHVLTNPVAGQEREFDSWYGERHLADVLQVPGFVSARRFWRRPGQDQFAWEHLAIYEIDADNPEAAMALLHKASETMEISSAMDPATVSATLFEAAHSPDL